MNPCPSELELERHLRSPRPQVESHAGTCARCRSRLAWAREAEATFRREVFPATVDRVVARSRPARARWLLVLAPATAAAAAAAVVFLAPSPPADYVGAKGGGGLGLTVYVQGTGGGRAVSEGAEVRADAGLRFEVRAARRCHLWLASLDAQGQVSRLHPPSGEPVPVEGAMLLPGGALLDGRPGPERLYAVCTPEPVPFGEIERAIRPAEGASEASVRAVDGLRGLPRGTLVATHLLEKRAAAP